MSTEAQKRASTNYNRKQDNIMIRPTKEEGAAIRAAAAKARQSVQAYVLQAVRERMEREQPEEQAQEHSSPSILEVMRQMAASGKSAAELTQERIAASAQDAHRGDNSIISPEYETDMDKVDLPF